MYPVKAMNKKENIMLSEKFPDNQSAHFCKNADEQFINSGVLYCNAIENADGVPFQLIFGPRPGEGYYLTVGSGISNLLGISKEEFTEMAFHEMIEEIIPLSDNMSSDLPESREKLINGTLKSYKAEVLIRMPGGKKKWIRDTSLPLIDDESGKVIGAFGILFDIDERKHNLLNLEIAKEKAEESDRLKSAFLHNLSHEIRTPLNAIVGFSSLLGEMENDPGKRQEFVDIIFNSSDHLLEIFDDIVEISNIEANTVTVRKEKVNLDLKLRKVYDRFRTEADEKKISLGYIAASDDNEVNVLTDGYKLSRVLTNLVGNALKFTSAGKVEFGYSQKGDNLEFYVSDTGIGIPPEHHEMIFKRFFQSDSTNTRRYEGTGLGLSISKAYIELLGGKIWLKSHPGEGSVFYFTLPFEREGE
jgi:signal transduction histidine kinase